jgi:hypothetical protein
VGWAPESSRNSPPSKLDDDDSCSSPFSSTDLALSPTGLVFSASSFSVPVSIELSFTTIEAVKQKQHFIKASKQRHDL